MRSEYRISGPHSLPAYLQALYWGRRRFTACKGYSDPKRSGVVGSGLSHQHYILIHGQAQPGYCIIYSHSEPHFLPSPFI